MATGPPPSIVRYPCVRTQVPRRSPPRNGGCDRPYIGSGRERVSGHEEAVAASLADDEAFRLEGPQRSGDGLTCRADRLAEELVRKRQLDADPPVDHGPVRPGQLPELRTEAFRMGDVRELGQALVALAKLGEQRL